MTTVETLLLQMALAILIATAVTGLRILRKRQKIQVAWDNYQSVLQDYRRNK